MSPHPAESHLDSVKKMRVKTVMRSKLTSKTTRASAHSASTIENSAVGAHLAGPTQATVSQAPSAEDVLDSTLAKPRVKKPAEVTDALVPRELRPAGSAGKNSQLPPAMVGMRICSEALDDEGAKLLTADIARSNSSQLGDVCRQLLTSLEKADIIRQQAKALGAADVAEVWLRSLQKIGSSLAELELMAKMAVRQEQQCREARAKMAHLLFFVYKAQARVPVAALTDDCFKWSSLPMHKPLSTPQLMWLLAVQDAEGHRMPCHQAYLEAVMMANQSSPPDAAFTSAQAQLRRAEFSLSQDRAYQAVVRHLGVSHGIHRLLAQRTWKAIIDQSDGAAAIVHLTALGVQIKRQRQNLAARVCLTAKSSDPVMKGLLAADTKFINWHLKLADEAIGKDLTFIKERRQALAEALRGMKTTHKHVLAQVGYVEFYSGNRVLHLTKENAKNQVLGSALQEVVGRGKYVEALLDSAQQRCNKYGAYAPPPSRRRGDFEKRVLVLQTTIEMRDLRPQVWADLLAKAQDRLTIYRHLDREYKANDLVADKVMYLVENSTLIKVLDNEDIGLLHELDAAIESAATTTKNRLSSDASRAAVVVTDKSPSLAAFGEDYTGLIKDAAKEARASHLELEELSGEQGDWSQSTRRRRERTSQGAKGWIQARFDAGTFASALSSCVYHYQKHGTSQAAQSPYGAGKIALDEDAMRAYVQEALDARQQWAAAQKHAWGYLVPSLLRPNEQVRVINHPDLFLIMTDEPNPKIVSFRNRLKYGR